MSKQKFNIGNTEVSVSLFFKYDKFKYKQLKKFDGKEVSDELLDLMQKLLQDSVDYKTTY